MGKKHMLAKLDTSLILGEGFRITRSKREFNPHVIQPEVLTTLRVQSEWLLRKGHQISEAAWADAVEEDTEVLDTSLPLFTPMSTTLKPLEGLLRPVDLQLQAKCPQYIPNMALTAAAQRKVKGHHRAQSSATAWTGSRVPVPYPKIYSISDVLALSGLQYVEWDARLYKSEDRLHWVALLGYSGDGTSWLKNAKRLDELLLQAHQSLQFPKHAQQPRRGDYDSLSVGYSHGQDQLHPMNFAVSKHNHPILQALLGSPEINRVACFMDQILLGIEGLQLKQVFKDCCYAASQLNFSWAATDPHLDFMNAFFLCCGIWNGGQFDYKRGGQFIM
ncbi:hypothetical protein F5879DRAFT_996333 [Lentinula edodes]|nr:hypothetical protein F5879DRAFT_996333 [Lentinula edodes]